jgi:predicted TIM-barrel fold metal-dependent hydrolase
VLTRHSPLLTPDRWLRDFETLDFKPEAKAKILVHNAAKVLGL